jgi:DNA invertase Pin-like site-specific DNA recombinase
MVKDAIYCRVSSNNQNIYNKSTSLQAQEQICLKFAHENKICVKSIFKEVYSAFTKTSKILTDLIEQNNNTQIIFSSVDRYSRNLNVGLALANIAIKNNNKLIFIQEKLICEDKSGLLKLKQYLANSESESNSISCRIKRTRTFLINNGMYTGGPIPYGYSIENKKLIQDTHELNIINFIKYCMNDTITYEVINLKMKQLQSSTKLKEPPTKYIPINLYDNDKIIKTLDKNLSLLEISDILNSYNILKRGVLWCPRTIKTAIKTYDPKVELGDFKITKWNEFSAAIDEIENTDESQIELKTKKTKYN